jgi:hypothetical protein
MRSKRYRQSNGGQQETTTKTGWVERFGEPLIFARSPFSPSNYLQAPQPKTNPFETIFSSFFIAL